MRERRRRECEFVRRASVRVRPQPPKPDRNSHLNVEARLGRGFDEHDVELPSARVALLDAHPALVHQVGLVAHQYDDHVRAALGAHFLDPARSGEERRAVGHVVHHHRDGGVADVGRDERPEALLALRVEGGRSRVEGGGEEEQAAVPCGARDARGAVSVAGLPGARCGTQSAPAVSHSCSRTVRSSRYIVLEMKSMPMVAWYVVSNLSYMKRVMMLVLPTDWSPRNTCVGGVSAGCGGRARAEARAEAGPQRRPRDRSLACSGGLHAQRAAEESPGFERTRQRPSRRSGSRAGGPGCAEQRSQCAPRPRTSLYLARCVLALALVVAIMPVLLTRSRSSYVLQWAVQRGGVSRRKQCARAGSRALTGDSAPRLLSPPGALPRPWRPATPRPRTQPAWLMTACASSHSTRRQKTGTGTR